MVETGSDSLLLALAKNAFEKAGWSTQVKTGRYAFDLGDNVRNTLSPNKGRMNGHS